MIDLTTTICLGAVTKVHGIKGKVILRLDHPDSNNIQKLESVFIVIDGLPVPFFIEEYEITTPDTLILSFTDIDDEESAHELTGCKLFIEKKYIKNPTSFEGIDQLMSLKGYTVIDKETGEPGKLNDILDIDMNPLFRIRTNKKEFFLPAQTEFITSIDSENKIIYIQTPLGLTDIF